MVGRSISDIYDPRQIYREVVYRGYGPTYHIIYTTYILWWVRNRRTFCLKMLREMTLFLPKNILDLYVYVYICVQFWLDNIYVCIHTVWYNSYYLCIHIYKGCKITRHFLLLLLLSLASQNMAYRRNANILSSLESYPRTSWTRVGGWGCGGQFCSGCVHALHDVCASVHLQ